MRTTINRLMAGFGISAALVIASPALAGAWPANASTQSAKAGCIDGVANIAVSFTNNERGAANDMSVVATDTQTGTSVDMGVIHAIDTDHDNSAAAFIYPNVSHLDAGTVKFHRHYVDGHAGDDDVFASYDAVDCHVPDVPSGRTSATSECKTDTGTYDVTVTVEHDGTPFVITSADLPGLTPWPFNAGTNAERRTISPPGSVTQSSYQLVATSEDGTQATFTGEITPALNGTCTKAVPITSTTTVAQQPNPEPGLPVTGGELNLVAAGGATLVGFGGLIVRRTSARRAAKRAERKRTKAS